MGNNQSNSQTNTVTEQQVEESIQQIVNHNNNLSPLTNSLNFNNTNTTIGGSTDLSVTSSFDVNQLNIMNISKQRQWLSHIFLAHLACPLRGGLVPTAKCHEAPLLDPIHDPNKHTVAPPNR